MIKLKDGINASQLNGRTWDESGSAASKIVSRDSSSDINARLFKSSYSNQDSISGAIAYRVNNSGDQFIRFCSNSTSVRNWIGAAPNSHGHDYLPLSGGTVNGTLHLKDVAILSNWFQMDYSGKRFGFGVGGSDVYLQNTKSGRAAQLQDNGNFAYNGSFISSSDKKLKEDIKYVKDTRAINKETPFLDFVNDFNPATFKYKNSDRSTFGFIAQDVYDTDIGKLFVSEEMLRSGSNENDYRKSLMYDLGAYTTVAMKAIQEESLVRKDEIKRLEEMINNIMRSKASV